MRRGFVPAIFVLHLTLGAASALAQSDVPSRNQMDGAVAYNGRTHTGDPRLTAATRIDSGSAGRTVSFRTTVPAPHGAASHRTRTVLIGGMIGSVVGIGVCTGISSLMNDSAKGGFSTCTAKGNIAFGVGGFAVGAVIGAVVRRHQV